MVVLLHDRRMFCLCGGSESGWVIYAFRLYSYMHRSKILVTWYFSNERNHSQHKVTGKELQGDILVAPAAENIAHVVPMHDSVVEQLSRYRRTHRYGLGFKISVYSGRFIRYQFVAGDRRAKCISNDNEAPRRLCESLIHDGFCRTSRVGLFRVKPSST